MLIIHVQGSSGILVVRERESNVFCLAARKYVWGCELSKPGGVGGFS